MRKSGCKCYIDSSTFTQIMVTYLSRENVAGPIRMVVISPEFSKLHELGAPLPLCMFLHREMGVGLKDALWTTRQSQMIVLAFLLHSFGHHSLLPQVPGALLPPSLEIDGRFLREGRGRESGTH